LWTVVTILVVLFAGYFLRKGFNGNPANSFSAGKLAQITTTGRSSRISGLGTDEKSFAYSREVNGFKKIFVKALQGETATIDSGTGDDIQPKWTPDAQSILFVRSQSASRQAGAG